MRETALEAYAHQDIPFETLVDELAPDREMSHTPLFQVMFVLQNTPVIPTLKNQDFMIEPLDSDSGLAKFDLTLTLAESADHLGGSMEFNRDLFNENTIERMIHHYEVLLRGLIDNPDVNTAWICLMPADEMQRVLQPAAHRRASYDSEQLIHQLFEQQVQHTPDALSVTFNNQSLTYGQLNVLANQLAHYLIDQGIQPGDTVGICLERNHDLVTAILAILKAGAAYVPLDPAYPPERLALIIENTAMPVILIHSHLADKVPPNKALIIALDQNRQAVNAVLLLL